MNCEKIQNVLFEYLEGELPNREQDEISTHINQCKQCCNELKVLENLKDELKSDTLLSPATGYWERLTRRTLSGLAERPQPLFIFRQVWSAGLVLAGILILIFNFYWFSAEPVKRMAKIDDFGGEAMEVKHAASRGLAGLNTAELKKLVNELNADYVETKVEISNNLSYPRNAYYENILELNNKEMKMMLNDQIFIQQTSGRR